MPSDQSFGISAILTVSGATSSFIFPPLMGFLVKDVFGYQETIMEVHEMPFQMLRKNAFALRDGIACLYRDSKAVQDKIEAEMNLTQVEVVKDMAYKRTLSRLDSM
ncbi:major facilitator superfamily MFS-1 protein [Theileria orientalis]|uniref:Major facilitator superfamily MFS-1 protein n=1 Tax=Theileria orientalis TaxID=68886 RepID=A0A976SIP2_THEOR|nr:major facilitator superfamily MFS-1 protein [Theileria orientalis]